MSIDRRTKAALAGAAAAVAGFAARKASERVWAGVTDEEPPNDPTDRGTSWGDAIMWTLLISAVVGLARLVTRRTVSGLAES